MVTATVVLAVAAYCRVPVVPWRQVQANRETKSAPWVTGTVSFRGAAIPGAEVSALPPTGGGNTAAATVSDTAGAYRLRLKPGQWELRAMARGFVTQVRVVSVGAQPARVDFALKIAVGLPPPARAAPAATTKPHANAAGKLAPGAALAVNGSENNGSASVYAQSPAFGNHRSRPSPYHGALQLELGASALDARSFSLSGARQPKPGYSHFIGGVQFGGPLRIGGWQDPYGSPTFFVSYQRTNSHDAGVADGLVPTAAERTGDLTALGGPLLAPGQIDAGAASLLQLYPLPNTQGRGYNYQIPLLATTHEDALGVQLEQSFGPANALSGHIQLASTRTATPDLFGFLDNRGQLGADLTLSWRHRFAMGLFGTATLHYTRQRDHVRPFFAGRENVSAAAGIIGNSQAMRDWGPPTLVFSSGFAPLGDAAAANNRDQTAELAWDGTWLRGRQTIQYGGAWKRLEFNRLQQENARGTLIFNGSASGNDFEDFLLGAPDAAQLAYGNADKYLRESAGDAFLTDQWQAGFGLTLTAGLRWDYSSPVGERQGRLVNLQVAPGFAAATTLVGAAAVPQPDLAGLQPRLGLAWRPSLLGGALLLHAGYGVYFDGSPYEAIALRMAQQAPLSTSLSVSSRPGAPLTLADAFTAATGAGAGTFAVDPRFRRGYVQIWNASAQAELPGAMALTASYQGSRGSHGMQTFLPNTPPPGSAPRCPACPAGFTYLTSGGRSRYESGTLQLQRQLERGFMALVAYTYSKNMDDAEPGGQWPALAQDWRDLDAEWARADADQPQRLSLTAQYSTGLESWSQSLPHAWERSLWRGWTLATKISAGSGRPLTPETLLVVPGTGVAGTVRPDATGKAPGAAMPGLFVNPAAFAPPAPGAWGTAGRNSVRGPSQFDLDASLARSFSLHGLDTLFRLDAGNALNHVSYAAYEVTVGSPLFGLPTATQPMRRVTVTLRVRF